MQQPRKMSDRRRIAGRISALCDGFLVKRYTRGKLLTDPLYDGVFTELRHSEFPLLDIGCGMGILAMYLRERGLENPVSGLDFDSAKISDGRAMVEKGRYEGVSLNQGDARTDLPDHCGDVAILDILQFFDHDQQCDLIHRAARRVAPGGRLVIRSGLEGKNLRFTVTWLVDLFAKATFWMKSAPVTYPTEAFFRMELEEKGFEVEIKPFWGFTPFNNFLILARRPAA